MSQKYAAIIRQYQAYKKQNPDTWIEHCRNQRNISDAIHFASQSRNQYGKKHLHQNRLKLNLLNAFEKQLQASQAQIKATKDFQSLHSLIESLKTKGIGELAIYDTAVRIGAYLGFEPDEIYLHAGTRIGANKLIPNIVTKTVYKNQLPDVFKNSNLTCYELEDLICIYKDDF